VIIFKMMLNRMKVVKK